MMILKIMIRILVKVLSILQLEKEDQNDGNKSLYLVFVGIVFFSASWTAFRAVRTAASWLFC
jgi:hypothetical protein